MGQQSKIVARHLSSRERAPARAGTGWWVRVDGLGFLPEQILPESTKGDLELTVDVPPGSAWSAGLAGTRGALRRGTTVAPPTYRIVPRDGERVPADVDGDGYDTRLAAEAQADSCGLTEYTIEEVLT